METTLGTLIKGKGSYVVSAKPKDTVYDCVQKMKEAHVGGLLVLEEDNIVGVFTERDLMIKVVSGKMNPETTLVHQVMNKKVMCVAPSTTIGEAMAIMSEKRIRHLPVIEDSHLAGLISIGDITKWLTSTHVKQVEEIDELIRYINGAYSV